MRHPSAIISTRLLVTVLLAGTIATRAQGPPAPAFRGGVDVVDVDVSVLDRDRRPVRGLTAADFTVFEDGAPRPIVGFALVEAPGPEPASTTVPGRSAAPWLGAVPLDVATNRVPAEGRLITIVFDWSIRFADQPLARRIARATVEGMGPRDLAAVLFTSGFANAGTSQSFTADRARLLEAIDRPMTPAREGVDLEPGAFQQDRQPYPWLFDPDGEQSGDCLCRVCVYDKVGAVADAVAGIPGRRKSMVFIGTYLPASSLDPEQACSVPIRRAREQATRKLALANMTIHVVDPAGTLGLDDGPIPADATTARAAGWPHKENRLTLLTEMTRQSRLPFLADLTGGRVITNDNGADLAVPAILDETSSYYVLAFESADRTASSSRVHAIDVRVNRPNVALQFRRAYQAGQTAAAREAAARQAPLVRAIDATLPRTDQALSLVATPFALPGRQEAAVAIVLRTEPPTSASPERSVTTAPQRDDVRVVVAAIDAQGTVIGSLTQNATLPWTPGGSAPAPYELLSRMELRPGRYEIRAASDLASGERSSVYGFVEVPDFGAARLSLSGVVLQALPGNTTAPRDAFATQSFARIPLPLVPTARRTFQASERVTALVRVYHNSQGGPAPSVSARIVDGAGTEVHHASVEADGPDYLLDIPVERLSSGEYLLEFIASASGESVTRRVRFGVQ